jgi:hypothetical protein
MALGVRKVIRYFIVLLGLGFSVFGTVWIVSACKFIATARRSRKWPLVPGVVLRTAVVLNDQSHLPTVEYSYDLGGQNYSGSSIHIGAAYASSEQRAKSVLDRYPAGSPTSVAVDPSHPSTSVLEPGTRWHMYMYLCAGSLITMLGCALLYLSATHWHSKSAQQGAQEGRAIQSRAS